MKLYSSESLIETRLYKGDARRIRVLHESSKFIKYCYVYWKMPTIDSTIYDECNNRHLANEKCTCYG